MPRIGHTLSKLDWIYILYGGLEIDSNGKNVNPTNCLYSLKLNGKTAIWAIINSTGDLPLSRCNHIACEINKS